MEKYWYKSDPAALETSRANQTPNDHQGKADGVVSATDAVLRPFPPPAYKSDP